MTPPEPAPTQPRQAPPFHLRVQNAGLGAMDPRTTVLLWASVSILLGLAVSILLVRGEIRLLVLMLLGVLSLCCLSPRRGVFILTTFLPFMYLLRRLVLTMQEFDKRDPILLFPVITAGLMLFSVLLFYGPVLLRYFRNSALMKTCLFLVAIFTLQVFNPLQGGLLVGVAGGMYFIIPILWIAFGVLLKREDIGRLFKLVMTIGTITALYGLYQHFYGLFAFEVYELKAKQFYKFIGDKSNVRVMSTFASLGDFSLYLALAGIVCFASFWRSMRYFSLMLFLINIYTMLWMSVRTSFLLLMFSVVILMILHARNTKAIVLRGAMAFVAIVIVYGVLYSHDPAKMYDQQFSANPYIVHTLSGITHPTKEVSFQLRLKSWANIVWTTVSEYPFGRGLGSTTPAAVKFEGGAFFEADSYFFEMFYGSGIVAPFLFLIVMYLTLRNLLRLVVQYPGDFTYKVVMALLCGVFLGSIFGLALRDMIAGPIAWLLIGWTIRQEVDHRMGTNPREA